MDYLDNLLVRELSVPRNIGSAVKNYFIALAKDAGLMDNNDILIDNAQINQVELDESIDKNESRVEIIDNNSNKPNEIQEHQKDVIEKSNILKINIQFNQDNFNYETKSPSSAIFNMIELMIKDYKKKFEEIKSSSND